MEKIFKPQEIEKIIYEKWEASGAFSPSVPTKQPHSAKASRGRPFTIMMPLPNVTGELHVGHALMLTLQDILTRYHRMRGEPTLYLPGKDHAAIAAQNVVEKKLWEEEKKTRHDLGREEFLKKMWEWMEKYGDVIEGQIRRLGVSCDWERKRFTMDEAYQASVKEAFTRLYKKGLIYQGERLVNWCPRCGTTLSDLEVEHEEKSGSLWYIRYPLADSKGQMANSKNRKTVSPKPFAISYITVATTRPETMLGDTAVAVNPKDRRYKNLVGKTALLPLMEREIPIVADEAIDPKFGTGALKVTPAHDPVDFEIGQKHKLPAISVIGFDDKMTKEAGAYAGMPKEEARSKIVGDLAELGLLEKEVPYEHAVGVCYRCRTTVEPLTSRQWFVKAQILAKPAIEAVKKGKIKIVPKRFEKIYFHWMENIKDWCISRQIWWGHPLPVKGSTDTLDTWFSSSLWPFAALGWPPRPAVGGTRGKPSDLEYFYPGTVLETGYDILFFWVARMIMMAMELTGEVPFRYVVLNGLVKDITGKKMSKTRPEYNIDPMEVIEKYGADALRMALVVGVSLGQDQIFSEEKILGYRNFANKVWNIGRFALLAAGADSRGFLDAREASHADLRGLKLAPEDKEILAELDQLVEKITSDLDNFRFSSAGEAVYQFMWHRLADIYIEKIKERLRNGDAAARETLILCVKTCLKLLHPFMPYVTESVWQELRGSEEDLLIASPWPETG